MDDDWLERSWIYQELVEEGRRRSFAKGITEGIRRSIQAVVQTRFPALADLAKERIEHIQHQDALHTVLVAISAASTERKTRRYLLALRACK